MTRPVLLCSLLLLTGIAAFAAYGLVKRGHDDSLPARIAQIVAVTTQPEISCADIAASHPLVLLALGQSNAGNHGSPAARPTEAVTLIAGNRCIKATDPLPGGTGTGGSIWQQLPAELVVQQYARPIVLSVLAVETTTIDDWTNPRSPLTERLAAHVASMHRLGLPPDLVLWQQGEADTLSGTDGKTYAAALGQLASILNKAGSEAPIMLARSTRCQSAPSATLRSAIDAMVASDQRFRLGPDTDTLSGDTFRTGCHLTAEGLASAAKMWATSIIKQASTIGPDRRQHST